MRENPIKRLQRGSALPISIGALVIGGLAAATYISSASLSLRIASRQTYEVQTTHLCEAGVQDVIRNLWRTFKTNQTFTAMDTSCTGASTGTPLASLAGTVTNVGRYSAGVISYSTSVDGFSRTVLIRAVGWFDANNNATLDANEPRKTIDVTFQLQLSRSQVFDYGYLVNNYGWMSGFNETDLIVNGDMRANANFDFTGGSPTVNGSVYACLNQKLTPVAAGLVNSVPVKWTTANYAGLRVANTASKADNEQRWRPSWNSSMFGAKGTNTYEAYRDLVFEGEASIVNGRVAGAVVGDINGSKGWTRTSGGASITSTLLDTNPTKEVIMPDLNNMSYYTNLATTYVDSKATYLDGTANPFAGQGAWIDVWDATLNAGKGAYKRVTTNGNITGSVTLVGTDANPIKIHGPIAVSQDVVIKGTISGQGTIYSGRNTHIVGSVRYKTKPNFNQGSALAIDQQTEKADMLGLAASGSIILGDTTKFTTASPLQYMTPPFTKARVNEAGVTVPAFNALEVDGTGFKKYQSVIGDAKMTSLAEGVNQVDAVLYTNFLGGGNVGTGGGGVIFNGSIISRDEAMVVQSLPMRINYDNRIRERQLGSTPLIDITLPRSPLLARLSWQDRGFRMAN